MKIVVQYRVLLWVPGRACRWCCLLHYPACLLLLNDFLLVLGHSEIGSGKIRIFHGYYKVFMLTPPSSLCNPFLNLNCYLDFRYYKLQICEFNVVHHIVIFSLYGDAIIASNRNVLILHHK